MTRLWDEPSYVQGQYEPQQACPNQTPEINKQMNAHTSCSGVRRNSCHRGKLTQSCHLRTIALPMLYMMRRDLEFCVLSSA